MQFLNINGAECDVWDTYNSNPHPRQPLLVKSIVIRLRRDSTTKGATPRWQMDSLDGVRCTWDMVEIPHNVVAACVVWLQSGGYPVRKDCNINEHISVLMGLVEGCEPVDIWNLQNLLSQKSSLSRAVEVWLQSGYGELSLKEFLEATKHA